MNYKEDPVFQTVQWLRGHTAGAPTFEDAFAAAWRDWAGEAPKDVRVSLGSASYEPFERVRIRVEATVVPGHGKAEARHLNLLVHAYADRKTAEAEFANGRNNPALRGDGPPVFFLSSRRMVIWTLPNAPRLDALDGVLNPRLFQSLLPSERAFAEAKANCDAPVLQRYSPSESALLTWDRNPDGERFYVKVVADTAKAAATTLNLRELHARGEHGEFGFSVPRLVRYSPEQQTLIISEVPGRPFAEIVRETRTAPFQAYGKALAELHGIPTAPLSNWSVDRELTALRQHMRAVRRALPNLNKRLDVVLGELERRARALPSTPPTSIHGNLWGDQLLYNEEAGTREVGILDFCDWCFGDPHFDLGRVIAHAIHAAETERLPKPALDACIAAFIAGYEETSGRRLHLAWLEWHIAVALLLRAKIHTLQQIGESWTEHLDFTVSKAEHFLWERPSMPAQRNIASIRENVA